MEENVDKERTFREREFSYPEFTEFLKGKLMTRDSWLVPVASRNAVKMMNHAINKALSNEFFVTAEIFSFALFEVECWLYCVPKSMFRDDYFTSVFAMPFADTFAISVDTPVCIAEFLITFT